MHRAGLVYAEQFGFAVFPCLPRAKIPLTRHGCKDATREPVQIDEWWRPCPDANVGIATGAASRIFVLDVDIRSGGDESLAALEARHGKFAATPGVLTPGGGSHYYFRIPGNVEIKNSAGMLAPGLDVRGEGGYVLAPPSIHPNGGRYFWEVSSRINEVALAQPPDYLLQLILIPHSVLREDDKKKHSPSNRINFARLAAGISEGKRDVELFRLACSLRQRGYSREQVTRVVIDAGARCHPPFSTKDAEAKVRSAWRYS